MNWKKNLNLYGIPDKVIVVLIFLAFISSFVEIIGISMFLPIFEFIDSGDNRNNDSSYVLTYINNLFSYFHINPSLDSLLLVTFILFLSSKIVIYFVSYIKSFYLGVMIKSMRDKMLRKYLSASSDYYDKVDIGNFVNSNISELGPASSGVMIPVNIIVTIFSAIGSVILLLLLSYKLTIVSIFIIIFSFIYPYRWVKATTSAGEKNSKFNSLTTSFLLGRLRSPRLVRLSGTSDLEINEYSLITEKQRKSTLNVHLLKAKVNLIIEPIVIGVSLLMLYFAMTVLQLELSVVILFMVVIIRIIPIVNSLISQIQGYNKTRGPVLFINKVLVELDNNISHKLENNNLSSKIKNIDSIELCDISFKYIKSQNFAINNISLSIESPSIITFIGESGAGKTTLVDILSGYRFQTSGVLKVNGIGLEKCDTALLSSLVSYVPQDPQIFDGSIRNHISYGSSNNTMENIIKASKLSGAYKYIEKLPDKFETILTDNGSNLSGGQRQKLDIARALMKNSDVLILDEPTSGMDHYSEDELNKILRNIRNKLNKIIIVVTHKPSVAKNADKIVVLKDGSVTDCGGHEMLLSSNNWYKDFYNN